MVEGKSPQLGFAYILVAYLLAAKLRQRRDPAGRPSRGELVEPPAPELDAERIELVEFVLEQTVSPIDRWAVAATLESRGLRDVDAAERFGKQDIFDLAGEIYAACRTRVRADPPIPADPPRLPAHRRVLAAAKLYLSGTFFALPMAIQAAALVTLGYSGWASLKFTNAQITTVAVVTILSFLATDGFVQSMGRLGSVYAEGNRPHLALEILNRVIAIGLLGSAVFGGAWAATALLGAFFPRHFILIGLVYYLLLAPLWLSIAVLYVLRRRMVIAVSIGAGIGAIAVLKAFTDLSIYAEQWIGLAVSIALATAFWTGLLRGRIRRLTPEQRLGRLPRSSLTVYAVAPYFLYGILYYSFLFMDRIVAWSAGSRPGSFPVWFRTPYELGLDWALVSIIPTIALLEFVINRFSDVIIPSQKRFSGSRIADHNRHFLLFYARQAFLVAAVTAAAAVGAYFGVLWFKRFGGGHRYIHEFFASRVTFDVELWGVVGYSLFAFGLLNGVFLLSLSRVGLMLRAFGIALAVSAAVEIPLSHFFAYWHAVVGMTAGAAVFAALTTRYAVRMLRNMDFSYYSAY